MVHAGDLEVEGQGAGRHSEPDPPGIAGPQPGDLLGDERRRAQREEEGRGGGPTHVVLGQHEGGHLQGLRHVAGEATVVLAGHDAVEAVAERDAGLAAELGDDGLGRQLVVRVEPDGDGARRKGRRVVPS